MSDVQLENLKIALIQALQELLEQIDEKEANIEGIIAQLEQQTETSDTEDLYDRLCQALTLKENKIMVQEELDRRRIRAASKIQDSNQFFAQTASAVNKPMMIPDPFGVQIDALKKEYDTLLSDNDIKDIDELKKVIADRQIDLETATKKNMKQKIQEAQSELDIFLPILAIFQKMEILKEGGKKKNDISHIQCIQVRLQEGLVSLQLYDYEEGDLEKERIKLEQSQIIDKRPKLELINQLLQYEAELKQLGVQPPPRRPLENQLSEIMLKYGLQTQEELEQNILETKEKLESAEMQADKDRINSKFEELKKAQVLNFRIQTKNETNIKEQQNQQSSNKEKERKSSESKDQQKQEFIDKHKKVKFKLICLFKDQKLKF